MTPRGLKPTPGWPVGAIQGDCIGETKGEGSISSERCPARALFDPGKKPWWMSPDAYKRVCQQIWCFNYELIIIDLLHLKVVHAMRFQSSGDFRWLWSGGQPLLLNEQWKLWKWCCTRCPVGRGDLKVTEATMLLQRMSLASHLLVSAPRGLKPTPGWPVVAVQGEYRRGKGRRLNFFSKVPGEGAIWSGKEALMNVTRCIQTSLFADLML